ncbi:hypothetical protein, partial [Flavobacterium sp.]|uniref:hypothetical protein n=1 Tax=Flavobacterium sp. TaxID=239 RepID=UPI00260DB469
FPGSAPGQYRMNLTDNFFSKDYGKNSFNDDVIDWLDIASHEVGHIKDIKEISSSKLKYFATFLGGYFKAGGHDGHPREVRAEKGTKEFRKFNKFIDSYYGKDKLKSLFENKHNKDKDIIERIDQWWEKYQKSKENQTQSKPKT